MKLKLGKSITERFVSYSLGGVTIIDKSPAEGLLVTIKGGTVEVVRKGSIVDVDGAYTAGKTIRMYDLEGTKRDIVTPEGVIFEGPVDVRSATLI